MSTAWIYLIVAGVFEWGWPVGLKLGVTASGYDGLWISFAGVTMTASGYLLLAQRQWEPFHSSNS